MKKLFKKANSMLSIALIVTLVFSVVVYANETEQSQVDAVDIEISAGYGLDNIYTISQDDLDFLEELGIDIEYMTPEQIVQLLIPIIHWQNDTRGFDMIEHLLVEVYGSRFNFEGYGFAGRIAAVAAFGNVLDLVFILTDTTGQNRTQDMHHLSASLFSYEMFSGNLSTFGGISNVINREDNSVTFHIRQIASQPFAHEELIFAVDIIEYSHTWHNDIVPNIENDVFLQAVDTMRFIMPEGASVISIMMDFREATQLNELLSTEGMYILDVHNLDYSFGLDDISTAISSVGIVEGRLHVQLYNPNGLYWENGEYVGVRLLKGDHIPDFWNTINWEEFMIEDEGTGFMRTDMEAIDALITWEELMPSIEVSFGIDDDGNFFGTFFDKEAEEFIDNTTYREIIFDIDLQDLESYSLLIFASSAVFYPVRWHSKIQLDLEDFRKDMFVELDNLEYILGYYVLTDVFLNPVSIILNFGAMTEVDLNYRLNNIHAGGSIFELLPHYIIINTTEGQVNSYMRSGSSSFGYDQVVLQELIEIYGDNLDDIDWEQVPIISQSSATFEFSAFLDIDSIISIQIGDIVLYLQ